MTNAVKQDAPSRPVKEVGARVFPIPPPLYYGAAFAGGMFLHGAVPLEVPGRPTTALAGAALLAAGVVLDAAGVAAVIAHRTTIVAITTTVAGPSATQSACIPRSGSILDARPMGNQRDATTAMVRVATTPRTATSTWTTTVHKAPGGQHEGARGCSHPVATTPTDPCGQRGDTEHAGSPQPRPVFGCRTTG